MPTVNADTIARLRADILVRQGLQKIPGSTSIDLGLGMMTDAFPNDVFPLGCVHEFVCTNPEDKTASTGFIAGLLSGLMKRRGPCLWISASQQLFPPALLSFGIEPEKIIFTSLPKEKDQLWVMEEALKCDSLSAVVGDIRHLDFTASRRLQLAVEQSMVTGLLVRQTTQLNTTACVSRWRIRSIASVLPEGMPGIGFPRWNVELLKIRNGKPGSWTLEWRNKRFREIPTAPALLFEQQRQTG